jgi:hypothetical protein
MWHDPSVFVQDMVERLAAVLIFGSNITFVLSVYLLPFVKISADAVARW